MKGKREGENVGGQATEGEEDDGSIAKAWCFTDRYYLPTQLSAEQSGRHGTMVSTMFLLK